MLRAQEQACALTISTDIVAARIKEVHCGAMHYPTVLTASTPRPPLIARQSGQCRTRLLSVVSDHPHGCLFVYIVAQVCFPLQVFILQVNNVFSLFSILSSDTRSIYFPSIRFVSARNTGFMSTANFTQQLRLFSLYG